MAHIKEVFDGGYNDSIEVIEPTPEAANKYGHNMASDLNLIKPEHIAALINGKVLAYDNGEYSHFFILDNSEQK